MQKELGFPSLRDSFLTPSKPTFLFRTFSLNFSSSSKSHSPFTMSGSFYASAPTTPASLFSQNSFFSVPNTPASQIFNSPAATPETTFSDQNSVEFQTPDHFPSEEFANEQKNKYCRRHHKSLPAMTFADEFFSDKSEVDESTNEQKNKCRRRHHGSLPAMAFVNELFSDRSKVDESANEQKNRYCRRHHELLPAMAFADEFFSDGSKVDESDNEQNKVYRRRHHESLPAMAFSDEFFSDESKVDEFEFDTSRRFELETGDHLNGDEHGTSHGFNENEKKEQNKKCRRHHGSLPAMAFADELFSEGKVMPLNPPPSQLHSSSYSSVSPPPGNPNARFRIPFTRSLWNDDFDPFMVALETVKEEKRSEGSHRRARSMVPLMACTSFDEEEMHENCLHSSPLIGSQSRRRVAEGNGEGRSPIRLTEPKGVLFARRARMVKLGYNYEKPIGIPSTEAAIVVKVGENGSERRSKWQKMVGFQMRRVSEEKDQSVEMAKSKLRKLSFKSKKIIQEKKEMQVAKMTLVRYRPKLLLCLGYGAK